VSVFVAIRRSGGTENYRFGEFFRAAAPSLF
jgi:hypothetical protein